MSTNNELNSNFYLDEEDLSIDLNFDLDVEEEIKKVNVKTIRIELKKKTIDMSFILVDEDIYKNFNFLEIGKLYIYPNFEEVKNIFNLKTLIEKNKVLDQVLEISSKEEDNSVENRILKKFLTVEEVR